MEEEVLRREEENATARGSSRAAEIRFGSSAQQNRSDDRCRSEARPADGLPERVGRGRTLLWPLVAKEMLDGCVSSVQSFIGRVTRTHHDIQDARHQIEQAKLRLTTDIKVGRRGSLFE